MESNNNETKVKRKIISFGCLSYKDFYPFVVAVFYILKNYCYYHIKLKDKDDLIWLKNPLFFTLLLCIGQSLNGIFYFVSYLLIRSRRNRNMTLLAAITIQRFKVTTTKTVNWSIYIYFLISAFMSVLTTSIINIMTSFYDKSRDLSFEMRIFNLFFIALLSYLILKYSIHRHQIFSFVFVVIGIAICFTIRFLDEKIIQIEYVFIYLGTYFIFSLREVFEKWMMEMKDQMPLKIVFYQGIMSVGITLVAMPIYKAIVPDTLPVHTLISLMFTDVGLSFLFIAHILFCTFYLFFSIYTKYYFSPTAMPIAYTFALVLWRIMFMFDRTFDYSEAFVIVGYVLLLFGCLVYNEIIVLYCFKLNVNTKIEISGRSTLELELYTAKDEQLVVV